MKHAHIVRQYEKRQEALNHVVAEIEGDPDPDGFWGWAYRYLGLDPNCQYHGEF